MAVVSSFDPHVKGDVVGMEATDFGEAHDDVSIGTLVCVGGLVRTAAKQGWRLRVEDEGRAVLDEHQGDVGLRTEFNAKVGHA